MDKPMIKIRYVVKGTEGRSTVVATHPVGVQLPTIGDQVMANNSEGIAATFTIASQPQFEYEAVGDETQKLVFVNYHVTR
jgi:hypothetical protein